MKLKMCITCLLAVSIQLCFVSCDEIRTPNNVSEVLIDKVVASLDKQHIHIEIQNTSQANPITSCKNFKLKTQQPKYNPTEAIKIKKCCPIGQSFSNYSCEPTTAELEFKPSFIIEYETENCLETDNSKLIKFELEHFNPCIDRAYLLDVDEKIYIIQNGRLLVMDMHAATYNFYDTFCVEFENGELTALVCLDQKVGGETLVLSIGAIFPAVALLMTSIVYFFVPPFNDTFGRLVSFYSLFFLIGLVLRIITKCNGCTSDANKEKAKVMSNMFFISSMYMFLLMNLYNFAYARYFLPRYQEFHFLQNRNIGKILFLATIGWIFFEIILLIRLNDPKYPFYISIVTIYLLCIVTVATTKYFLIKKIKVMYRNVINYRKRLAANENLSDEMLNKIPRIDVDKYSDVKTMTTYCTVLLTIAFGIRVCLMVISKLKINKQVHNIASISLIYIHALLIFFVFIIWRGQYSKMMYWWRKNSDKQDSELSEDEGGIELLARKEEKPEVGWKTELIQ